MGVAARTAVQVWKHFNLFKYTCSYEYSKKYNLQTIWLNMLACINTTLTKHNRFMTQLFLITTTLATAILY